MGCGVVCIHEIQFEQETNEAMGLDKAMDATVALSGSREKLCAKVLKVLQDAPHTEKHVRNALLQPTLVEEKLPPKKGTNPPNKDTENKEKCVLCTTSPTVGSPSKAENEWKRPNKTNCRPCYSCRRKGKPRNSSWPTREVGPLGGVQRTQQGPALPWVRHVKLETRKRSKTWIWT